MLDDADARAAGVRFYELPRNLTADMVDPLIWPIVKKINDSAIAWTAESCQGHPDATEPAWAGNNEPMLRLVCRRDRMGRVMAALIDACERVPAKEFEEGSGLYSSAQPIKIFPHTEEVARKQGWAEILIYLSAGAVWSRDRALRVLDSFADELLKLTT